VRLQFSIFIYNLGISLQFDGHGHIEPQVNPGKGITLGAGATFGPFFTTAKCTADTRGDADAYGVSATAEGPSVEANYIKGSNYWGIDSGFGASWGLPVTPQFFRNWGEPIRGLPRTP
jgi:hypothetical protein